MYISASNGLASSMQSCLWRVSLRNDQDKSIQMLKNDAIQFPDLSVPVPAARSCHLLSDW